MKNYGIQRKKYQMQLKRQKLKAYNAMLPAEKFEELTSYLCLTLHFSTVLLGAIIKCKQYSGITVENITFGHRQKNVSIFYGRWISRGGAKWILGIRKPFLF